MKFITDFHIHSHYSLATSKEATPEYLEYWAKLKGVDVLGTGDCIHPRWFNELKEKFTPNENGLLSLNQKYTLQNLKKDIFLPKNLNIEVNFILTTEISNIYKKNGKVRKVHNLCIFPNFEAVEKFQKRLEKIGNIKSDGRPILGLDSKILLELLLETDEKAFLIPAHIWTPWFSVLGSRSGFDSIEECYEDLTKYIFALETGLSSDPPMNWMCSFLDKFNLVSNSDAHSPEKIGREANIFNCDKTYNSIYAALKYDKGFVGTIEFFPQEGKYHYDGHKKCNICFDPLETIMHQGFCPVCNKPLVKGVMYRVAELSDRKNFNEIKNVKEQKEFYSITSLLDLVSEITGKGPNSVQTKKEYRNILENIGNDFYTLLFADLKQIEKYNYILCEGIRRLRQSNVHIKSGYDGEFGEIKVFEKGEIAKIKHIPLFDEKEIKNSKNQNEKKSFNIDQFKAQRQILRDNYINQKLNLEKYIDLTDTQKMIINHLNGPCIVIAGPGTGKTRVLVERIEMLILSGVSHTNILAITFSNKAAEEIRERLSKKINLLDTNILTFHKLGLEILKKNYLELNRTKDFFIIDEDEKKEILEKFVKDKRSIQQILRYISFHKQGIDIVSKDIISKEKIMNDYNSELERLNAFDIDDLIYYPVELIKKDTNIEENYKKLFKYILIDEYQDINSKQYELITSLVPKENPNLFVIGDPDQSIYGFRGSDRKFIETIQADYPNIKKIELQHSYRCPNNVLKLAGQVLNKKNFLEGNLDSNIKTEIVECDNDDREATFIASKIDEMIGGIKSLSRAKHQDSYNIHSFSDFAILCRTTKIFDKIVKALEKNSIPVQVVGQLPFFQEKPFIDAIKRFKKIFFGLESNRLSKPNFDDEILAFEAKQDVRGEHSEINSVSREQCSRSPKDKIAVENSLQKKSNIKVQQMLAEKIDLKEIFFVLLENIEICKSLSFDLYEDNKKKFFCILDRYKNNYLEFFRSTAINIPVDEFEIKQEAVSVMTIHAAKGLEFQTIFVPGCEEGIIPFKIFGAKTKEEIEEEERLFFVAITRTKQYLFLTHTKKRYIDNRLFKLKKSFILDRFEESLLNQSKLQSKNSVSQIEFNF